MVLTTVLQVSSLGSVFLELRGGAIKVLECRSISKWYGDSAVLKKVDFELDQNEIHAIVGENGAGKSTVVKVLTGIYQPNKGDILLNGKPIHFSMFHYLKPLAQNYLILHLLKMHK